MSKIETVIEERIDSLTIEDLLDIHGSRCPGWKLYERIADSNLFDEFIRDTFRVRSGEAGEKIEELIEFTCRQCLRNLCEDDSYQMMIEQRLESEFVVK